MPGKVSLTECAYGGYRAPVRPRNNRLGQAIRLPAGRCHLGLNARNAYLRERLRGQLRRQRAGTAHRQIGLTTSTANRHAATCRQAAELHRTPVPGPGRAASDRRHTHHRRRPGSRRGPAARLRRRTLRVEDRCPGAPPSAAARDRGHRRRLKAMHSGQQVLVTDVRASLQTRLFVRRRVVFLLEEASAWSTAFLEDSHEAYAHTIVYNGLLLVRGTVEARGPRPSPDRCGAEDLAGARRLTHLPGRSPAGPPPPVRRPNTQAVDRDRARGSGGSP